MRTIETGEYLVKIGDGATVLCEKHKDTMVNIMQAAQQMIEVYAIDPEEEPMSCQACHLAAVKDQEGWIQ